MAFLSVGDQSLHVFQRAGDPRLAMALQHRKIDQKIDFFHAVADFQFHSSTVLPVKPVFLCIDKFHAIFTDQTVITADLKGVPRFIPHPGAFQDHQILKAMLPEIFDRPGHDLRMGRRSPGRLARRHKIRLQPDPAVRRRNPSGQVCRLQKLLCHLFIIRTVNHPQFIFIHFCPILTSISIQEDADLPSVF